MAATPDPIQAAFEKAVDDFKGRFKDEQICRDILKTKTIDDVYSATEALQAEQAKNGHLRHLSKIDPYLTRLNDYAGAIQVFIQAKADVLALIWGPIVLLLQWANVLKTSFDAVVDATAEIGLALPEFKQAVLLFRGNHQIKGVLLLFFKDILEFYAVTLRFFRLSRQSISCVLARQAYTCTWLTFKPHSTLQVGNTLLRLFGHSIVTRSKSLPRILEATHF